MDSPKQTPKSVCSRVQSYANSFTDVLRRRLGLLGGNAALDEPVVPTAKNAPSTSTASTESITLPITSKDSPVLATTKPESPKSSTTAVDSPSTSIMSEDPPKPSIMSNGAPNPSTTSEHAPKPTTTSSSTPILSTTNKDSHNPSIISQRTNQWFVPGNDIAREVITADITRYIGPDALVRPGLGTGDYQGEPGYWITAYRCLTFQMIQDLKLDSQRWQQERQLDQAGRSSVAYQDSQTHAARQHWGPTTPYDSSSSRFSTERYTGRSSYDARASHYSSAAERYYPGQSRGYVEQSLGYVSPASPYPSVAAAGYYIASDGRQYPLSQQPSTNTKACGNWQTSRR